MLGYYNYTTWLTYASLLLAGGGILVSLNGTGHPYIGMFFLMLCGLCDAFDGRVARSKKDRTQMEKNFGIQIDSLADLVAFGVLPACIGNAMIRVLPTIPEQFRSRTDFICSKEWAIPCGIIMVLYMLTALIRLAYFNVTEEERQRTEGGCRRYFEGLPVTSAALIFPFILALQYVIPTDITPWYFVGLILTGLAFVSRIKIPKPDFRGIMVMVGIGAVLFIVLVVMTFVI